MNSRALCDFLVACWLCIVFAVSRAFNEAVLPPEFADIDSGRHKGHVQRLGMHSCFAPCIYFSPLSLPQGLCSAVAC